MQLTDAVEHGYWHARLTSFYHSPLVSGLLWARMLPDLVFTAGVIVLIIIVVGAFFNLKPAENEQHEKESKIVLDELAAENK
jgi:nitric oxide reductase subunit B